MDIYHPIKVCMVELPYLANTEMPNTILLMIQVTTMEGKDLTILRFLLVPIHLHISAV